jgi:hypothetical protein
MTITQNDVVNQEVLFTRQNLDHIGERFASYLLQRKMPVNLAWKQAVEDEAQIIKCKLELMEEGVMLWDWPSLQLSAMKREVDRMAEAEKAVNQ